MSFTSLVERERVGGIAIVRLNRPEKLNAVTVELLEAVRDALAAVSDESANGLVLSGNGTATCAGMDTDIVSDDAYDEKYGDAIEDLNAEVYQLLREYPYPTVMAAHGALIGIGFCHSVYCDFLVAGNNTRLSLPEIKYGLAVEAVLPELVDIVGARAAKEIALTGEPVSPSRAHELGLVTEIVPEAEVEDTARTLAEKIAAYDSQAVRDVTSAVRTATCGDRP